MGNLKEENVAIRAENLFLKKRITCLEAELIECKKKHTNIMKIILSNDSDKSQHQGKKKLIQMR